MKDYKTLIADIRTEACELADKLKRLEVFMMSEDFCKISPEQKGLLETQYDLMAKYKVTLVKRAHRINFEHANRTTKEKLKEFVEEREESEKRPPALTFDTNPEICEKCIHPKKSWSACHDCEDGSNFKLKKQETLLACETCRWGEVSSDEIRCNKKNKEPAPDCYERRSVLDGPQIKEFR